MKVLRFFLLAYAIGMNVPAVAQSCYVTVATSGEVPPPVVTEKCFEYRGMNDETIDWACQDNEAVKNSRREKRDSCPTGHFGICTAAMTSEALANERATGSQASDTPMPTTVPDEAQIRTYYYEASDRAQARIDCESAGGEWSQ